MTITQCNSNNSLTYEFKWSFFEKRNIFHELINVPTKAEERSMIQISFKTQDPNIRQEQKLQLIHVPLCIQNLPIRSIYCKNSQSVRLRQIRRSENLFSPFCGLFTVSMWPRDEIPKHSREI